MRNARRVWILGLPIALVQFGFSARARGELPEGWEPAATLEMALESGDYSNVYSESDEALGPDGRWHRVYAVSSSTWAPRTPEGLWLRQGRYELRYQNEAGEDILLAEGTVSVWDDDLTHREGGEGTAIGFPSISVNARGEILVGYILGTYTGSGPAGVWGPTYARVLLRRRSQLQRWETSDAGGQFVPAYPADVEAKRIDPDKPTVVLVHGWNSASPPHVSLNQTTSSETMEPQVPLDCENPTAMGIWHCLAQAMAAKGVNVLAWDWLYEARSTEDGRCPGQRDVLEGQGRRLVAQLRNLLGTAARPLHLIGHSLGAGVAAYCAAAASSEDGIGRVTLLDVPETRAAQWFPVRCNRLLLDLNVIPQIRDKVAIDNYFSLAGCGYEGMGDDDLNVDLRRAAGYPRPSAHAYPRNWYLATVEQPDICVLHAPNGSVLEGQHGGWWWAPGADNHASPARHWYARAWPYDPHYLYQPEDPSVCDRVVGTGNQGFVLGTWEQSGSVDEGEGVVTLREGSSAAIWQTVSLGARAAAIAFDYFFENKGDGDSLSVYWNDEVLWRQTGSEFEGTDFKASGLIDLSAYREATGVLKFALESTGEANAVVKLRNLEFSESCCPDGYDLVIVVSGEGTVEPAGGRYEPGTTVEVRAKPAQGWRFDHWEDDVPAGQEASDKIAVVMEGHRGLFAVFEMAGAGQGTPEQPCGGCGALEGVTMMGMVLGLMFMRRRRWM